jgi:hypothetical protein
VNYTNRATATCRWNYCQPLRVEGVAWSAQRIPTTVNLGFLDIWLLLNITITMANALLSLMRQQHCNCLCSDGLNDAVTALLMESVDSHQCPQTCYVCWSVQHMQNPSCTSLMFSQLTATDIYGMLCVFRHWMQMLHISRITGSCWCNTAAASSHLAIMALTYHQIASYDCIISTGYDTCMVYFMQTHGTWSPSSYPYMPAHFFNSLLSTKWAYKTDMSLSTKNSRYQHHAQGSSLLYTITCWCHHKGNVVLPYI